jgi:hypothetical protein
VTQRQHFHTPIHNHSVKPSQTDRAQPVPPPPRTLADTFRHMSEHGSPAVRAAARRLLAEGEHASSDE